MHWHTLGLTGACKGGLLVKRINARAALISMFLGLGVVTQGHAEEYYIYQTLKGELVISNKEPPPGSKIIRQHSWPEVPEKEVAPAQEPGKTQSNVQPEGSPKLAKNKQRYTGEGQVLQSHRSLCLNPSVSDSAQFSADNSVSLARPEISSAAIARTMT